MTARYAVYLAPLDTALWRLGSATIGYDAAAAIILDTNPPQNIAPETWRDWTAEPARYGFHATLKAPFGLQAQFGEADLDRIAAGFASGRRARAIDQLAVRLLGPFVALVPAEPSAAADELAGEAVAAFEPCRAPLGEADRARRLAAPLTPRQVEHLDRWGYPYVLDDFRFHMTLTGPLPESMREPVRAALAERFAAIEPGLSLDAITLFVQPSRSERFRVWARYPFSG